MLKGKVLYFTSAANAGQILVGWLLGSLFNNAFSVRRLYSVDDRMISECELERIW
jgi:hypothetical protein